MTDQRHSVPLGSLDPNLPAPLPKTPPKVWGAREGAVPDAKPRRYTATFDEILQPTPDVRLFRLSLDGFSRIMPQPSHDLRRQLVRLPNRQSHISKIR